ncbi:MAG: ATP synthase F1 subunit epsilon [Chloroflexi bacterium]|nr:ATP synthase F1 subunit epsilon [Chloroflexota bacterium]
MADGAKPAPGTEARLDVTVVTGDRMLYHGPAVALTAPAVQGTVTIRPHHAPLLALLQPGELDIVHQQGTDTWAVGGGFVEVVDDAVTVLADTAERAEEIDLRRAEDDLERARLLAKRHEIRAELQAAHDLALRRSRARIAVARKALQRGS